MMSMSTSMTVNDQNVLWFRYASCASTFDAGREDTDHATEHVADEDQESRDDHDRADDQDHPAPCLDVVRDRELATREPLDVVRLR